jgi:predicted TIM-barrel fold metal-dependent hydrolase
MITVSVLAKIAIVDTDSHVTEPPDLWTDRVSKRWGDDVPHVVDQTWVVGGQPLIPVTLFAGAGWPEPFPSCPPTLEEADPASFDPEARLKRLDEYGVHAQVLYPNLIAFFSSTFMKLEPRLGFECVRAYNDFLVDFASVDPKRLVPLMMLPFWDVEESVREIERCNARGHKGILFAATFDRIGLPNIPDPHWAPILDAAQSLDLSINLHIGFMATDSDPGALLDPSQMDRMLPVERAVLGFMSNARPLIMLMLNGVCRRYPTLKFVSVESGFGWVPFLLEGLDWEYKNSGLWRDHPEWLLPSEYFRRQIYATYWFETPWPEALAAFQDNVMWETDFPHPMSLSPGPSSVSLLPYEMVERNASAVAPNVLKKVLHDNAAAVYHLE